MPSKKDLRRHFRRQRQSLPPDERRRAEKHINNLLKGYLKRGKRLAVYWPIGSELRLDSLTAAARQRGTKLYRAACACGLPPSRRRAAPNAAAEASCASPSLPDAKSASTTCTASSSP